MGHSPMRAGMAALLLLVAAGAGFTAFAAGRGVTDEIAPTRDDLDALRRRVALLESELALSKSRKPYVVVDAPAKRLRHRLLGMTMREIPLRSVDISVLRRAGEGGVPGPLTLAGIVTLKEKEDDPRLTPLTPADIEAGAADENVADALPPEAPAEYTLKCRQPVIVRAEGLPEKKTAWSRAASWWRRLWPGAGGGKGRVGLRVALRLEEAPAREIYRSLVPGGRLVLVPPRGFLLPDAGQEAPRSVRPARPAKPPLPGPGPPAQGVPFQIPPPVQTEPENGSVPANGTVPGDSGTPGQETAPGAEGSQSPPAGTVPASTPAPLPTPTPGAGPADRHSPPGSGDRSVSGVVAPAAVHFQPAPFVKETEAALQFHEQPARVRQGGERQFHGAAVAVAAQRGQPFLLGGEGVLDVGATPLPAQIQRPALPRAAGAGRQVEGRAAEGPQSRAELQIEPQSIGVHHRPPHGVQAVACLRGLDREEDLLALRERQELAPVHRELGSMAANGAALAVLFRLRRFEAGHVRPVGRHTGLHDFRQVHDVAQGARRALRGQAAQGKARQDGQGAVVGVQVERRRQDQEGRPPVGEQRPEPIHGRFITLEQEAGDRLVGEAEEDGVIRRQPQLRKGGERFLVPAPAEAGRVFGADPEPPLDQALRPRIVLAVGGEHDAGAPAACDRALHEASRGERFVVGVRRQKKQALACARALPFHGVSPYGENGEKPLSAACAQNTAIRRSPAAGRNSCRPGVRWRGPSYGRPSSMPRGVPASPATA